MGAGLSHLPAESEAALNTLPGDLHPLSSPGPDAAFASPAALASSVCVVVLRLHPLVLLQVADFNWVWDLIFSEMQLQQGSLGAGGVMEVGPGTKKVDFAGSCRHLPEPAGKVIFGAKSLGVIGALLCERASLPWPSGAMCPAQSLLPDDSLRIADFCRNKAFCIRTFWLLKFKEVVQNEAYNFILCDTFVVEERWRCLSKLH